MKRFLYLFCALLVGSFLMTACEPDTNDDVNPTDPRESYQGIWLCTESTSMSYTVDISIDTTNSTQIKLFNFHHLGPEEMAYGIVSGTTVTIPSQTLCQGTITVEGIATMQSNKTTMNFDYYVSDGVTLDTIQAVYTKQSS